MCVEQGKFFTSTYQQHHYHPRSVSLLPLLPRRLAPSFHIAIVNPDIRRLHDTLLRRQPNAILIVLLARPRTSPRSAGGFPRVVGDHGREGDGAAMIGLVALGRSLPVSRVGGALTGRGGEAKLVLGGDGDSEDTSLQVGEEAFEERDAGRDDTEMEHDSRKKVLVAGRWAGEWGAWRGILVADGWVDVKP